MRLLLATLTLAAALVGAAGWWAAWSWYQEVLELREIRPLEGSDTDWALSGW